MADMSAAAMATSTPATPEPAYHEGHDADHRLAEAPDFDRPKSAESKSGGSNTDFERDVEKGELPVASRQPPQHDEETPKELPRVSGQKSQKSLEEKSSATQEEQHEIVDWDGPDDPANPMNWTTKKKFYHLFILSILTLVSPLASSMFAPAVPEVEKDFHNDSSTLAEFVVSVYILGFAIGPLFVSPLSEMYGRCVVYNCSNAFFIIFTVACAVSTNINMLIGFRFLAGMAGIAPITIGGGTIADMIVQEKRGGIMAIWAMGPLIGPVIGPVAGGYLAGAIGWRWVFWLLAIIEGAFAILNLIFTRETYQPILLERKAARLRRETGNVQLRSKLDSGLDARELFFRSIIRPSKMLVRSPIVFLMSLYMAVAYGIMYLLFTTFTFVFTENYSFTQNNVGLTYIGTGIGMLIALVILGATSDRIVKRLAARTGGAMKPEYRLPPLIIGGFFIPVGLFIYGWTAQNRVQWAVPLLGTLFVGMGMLVAFMCIQTYLIDAFTIHAASAIAANTVLRSIFGAVLPLCGLEMYAALGLGWGNSLLGFVALALAAVPPLFWFYGESIRTNPRFQAKF